jgi:hypothetical protein
MSLNDVIKIMQIIAYFGALGTFVAGIGILITYKKHNNIKRVEFIDQVYKMLDEDKDIEKLHGLLIEDAELTIPLNSVHEPALVKALTLFDRIYNYYEFKIINKKALSYIAAEILDFYNHNGVIEYIDNIHKHSQYENKGYIEDIRFYSGLQAIGEICTKKFITKQHD